MKIVFIVNKRIKKYSPTIKEITSICHRQPVWKMSVWETKHRKHAIQLAKKAITDDYKIIVAVGGDGTLNEVIQGVMKANKKGSVKIGLLPRGTSNDFAKTLKIKNNIDQLAKLISTNTYQTLNVGQITFSNPAGINETRHFINIADIGIGAKVVCSVEASRKTLGPDITFIKSILGSFLTYQRQNISCSTTNWDWQGQVLSMAIANGKYFGSGMCIAPDADPTGDVLHVTLLSKISIIDYILNLTKIKKGIKIKHDQVVYQTGKYFSIQATKGVCSVEADGEFLGFGPVTIGLIPQAVDFLCPKTEY